jgi:hypothetical protein
MRAEAIRAEVLRRVREAPFRPFVLSLESGDRVLVQSPENIAFEPIGPWFHYFVISGRIRHGGSFEAVADIVESGPA